MLRESNTIVVERNWTWTGSFETEPVEAAWAREAIFFVRALELENVPPGTAALVQISPDGIHWCNDGSGIALPLHRDEVTFSRVSHFGGWLRISGQLPPDAAMTVIVYLNLKA